MSAVHSYAGYKRRFRVDFRYGGHSVREREGVILRRRCSDGRFLFSEASPLASHSRESLATVLLALAELRDEELLGNNPGRIAMLPPSLRFAAEGLQLLAAPAAFVPVRSNALLPALEIPELRREIARLKAEGYSCFKCKLPVSGWKELAGLFAENSNLSFRLDANGCLDASGLERLISELERQGATAAIEYIEEPFRDVWGMRAFSGLPLPLAADESAWDGDSVRALCAAPNPPSVFILKPTVYGALTSLDALAGELEAAGKKVVFSSSLECEPGRRSLLAFLSQKQRAPAGLSTGFLFENSFLPDRALWSSLPATTPGELAWLESLAWKDLSC